MYWSWVYKSFIQLRKQLYKLKTQKQLDRYSKIEFYKKEYKTFRKFSEECEEYFWRRYQDEPTEETIQEVFDKCLEMSQKRQLSKFIFWC